MKKVSLFLALASSLTCLVGCDDIEDDLLKDSDFDGLYDYIDPLKYDNEFTYYYQDDGIPENEKSNEISAKVDFHYFLKDEFNLELSKMSGLLSYFGYPERGVDWYFRKNKYENEESKLNSCLVNFGFENIVQVGKYRKGSQDEYDVCGAFFGNHLFKDEDGKKYQIVASNIIGYPNDVVWNSNFDFGADTEGYLEISKENADHRYWENKKHHKGFDVSANKFYPELLQYLSDVKIMDVPQIVWVTGHSRAGAISNLIGKMLFDDGIRSVCYCFNNPNNTTESDPEVLNKYKNIYNIRPENDLMSQFPFAYQGFTSYGNQLNVNLSLPLYAAEYKRIFKTDFGGNTKEMVESVINVSREYFQSRESIYEYSEKFSSVVELEAQTLEEAELEIVDYQLSIESANLNNITKLEIIENPDYVEGLTAKYLLKYISKPFIVFRILGEVLVRVFTSVTPIIDVILYVLSSFSFVREPVLEFVLALFAEGVSLDFNRFGDPHDQKTTVVGSYCVLD